MRVLVLGATDLVGNNVLRAAIEAGWETVAFDWPKRRRCHPALETLSVEIAPGVPEDPQALRRAMKRCEVVFHAAGYAPPNSLRHAHRLREAREHVAHVLRAAGEAEIGRLVFTSSVSTIGRPDSPTRLPDEWNNYRLGNVAHPYWDAMLAQEEAVLAFGREGKIPVVVVNPAAVVGPYDFQMESAGPVLEMARRGTRRYLPGKVSITDVRDVAKGHILAATQGRPGERYILAGHNITRPEMVATLARACKRPAPDKPVNLIRFGRMTRFSERLVCLGQPNRPFPLSRELEAIQQCWWYDSSKAKSELGYAVRPLQDTYRTTLAWLKAVRLLRE